MKPELQKLFEGVNGLSTDFLDKVSNLLETKVDAARVQAIQETEAAGHQERLKLVESHQAEINTLKESYQQEMAESLDKFLNGVVEEWANKNAPAIDAKIKTEAAENLLAGLTGVLKEASINFATDPEGRIAALTNRLAEAERRAEEASTDLNQLREAETKRQRDAVISRVCEGMVETKKETVLGLLEGIEFKSESEFASRVGTFRNLVEGKSAKKEGDDSDDDFKDKVGGKDGDDDNKDKVDESKKPKKEGDDSEDDDDADETDKEVNESIRNQLEAYARRFGLNG